MTVTDRSPSQLAHDEPQALFPEARRRRRRRRVIGIGLLLLLVAAALAFLGSGHSAPSHRSARHGVLPRWVPLSGTTAAAPAVFVAGDGKGGAGVYSTATGKLIRTLSPQGPGGPDQQIVLSGDRHSVYFAQPSGPCGGSIVSAPVSGTSAPVAVVSHPGFIALAPSADPASSALAWVGETCTPKGGEESSTLYVSDLAAQTTDDLGPYSGQVSDNEIAWSSDGRVLAVQSGLTVKVFDVDPSSQDAVSLNVPAECRLTNPAFFPRTDKLAVIRTCYDSTGFLRSSMALVFNLTKRKPEALIAKAPSGAFFRGLSIDSSGQHILLGLNGQLRGSPNGEDVKVEHGTLVPVSHDAPTDAQW